MIEAQRASLRTISLERMLLPWKDSELLEAHRWPSTYNGGHLLTYGFRVNPARPLQYFIDRLLQLELGTEEEREYLRTPDEDFPRRAGIAISMLDDHMYDLAYGPRGPMDWTCSLRFGAITDENPKDISIIYLYKNNDAPKRRTWWTEGRKALLTPFIRQVFELPDDAELLWYYDSMCYARFKKQYGSEL